MARKCFLPFCKNKRRKKRKGVAPKTPAKKIRFFRVSKARAKRWVEVIGRDVEERQNARPLHICSEHFKPEDIIQDNIRPIRLSSRAVPSLHLKFRDINRKQRSGENIFHKNKDAICSSARELNEPKEIKNECKEQLYEPPTKRHKVEDCLQANVDTLVTRFDDISYSNQNICQNNVTPPETDATYSKTRSQFTQTTFTSHTMEQLMSERKLLTKQNKKLRKYEINEQAEKKLKKTARTTKRLQKQIQQCAEEKHSIKLLLQENRKLKEQLEGDGKVQLSMQAEKNLKKTARKTKLLEHQIEQFKKEKHSIKLLLTENRKLKEQLKGDEKEKLSMQSLLEENKKLKERLREDENEKRSFKIGAAKHIKSEDELLLLIKQEIMT